METLKIKVEELTDEKIKSLKAGDLLLLSGEIYTARDAAHERMVAEAKEGKADEHYKSSNKNFGKIFHQ